MFAMISFNTYKTQLDDPPYLNEAVRDRLRQLDGLMNSGWPEMYTRNFAPTEEEIFISPFFIGCKLVPDQLANFLQLAGGEAIYDMKIEHVVQPKGYSDNPWAIFSYFNLGGKSYACSFDQDQFEVTRSYEDDTPRERRFESEVGLGFYLALAKSLDDQYNLDEVAESFGKKYFTADMKICNIIQQLRMAAIQNGRYGAKTISPAHVWPDGSSTVIATNSDVFASNVTSVYTYHQPRVGEPYVLSCSVAASSQPEGHERLRNICVSRQSINIQPERLDEFVRFADDLEIIEPTNPRYQKLWQFAVLNSVNNLNDIINNWKKTLPGRQQL
jgi:hypothetical protein